jgi:hypothetical protein
MKEWGLFVLITIWVVLFSGTPDLHDKIMDLLDRQAVCQKG